MQTYSHGSAGATGFGWLSTYRSNMLVPWLICWSFSAACGAAYHGAALSGASSSLSLPRCGGPQVI
jgi:hypothetical protein